ncbi:MAG: hypothetical protein OXI29_00345 [bacterium]|nr:hypothetical protein [bacterium]
MRIEELEFPCAGIRYDDVATRKSNRTSDAMEGDLPIASSRPDLKERLIR